MSEIQINTDRPKWEECDYKENVEHVLLKCKKFQEERRKFKECIITIGREWNIKGILGYFRHRTFSK